MTMQTVIKKGTKLVKFEGFTTYEGFVKISHFVSGMPGFKTRHEIIKSGIMRLNRQDAKIDAQNVYNNTFNL